jgi:hypothetical protein
VRPCGLAFLAETRFSVRDAELKSRAAFERTIFAFQRLAAATGRARLLRWCSPIMTAHVDKFTYDDSVVRKFAFATIVWGLVATLAGLWLALMLVASNLSFGLPYLTFGRLRPLHTNAAIFAFAGNAIFAAVYYSSQRLLKARMFSDRMSSFHFWGWQAIIVAAALTLPFGITQSKEYAELEWPIDVAIAVVWGHDRGGRSVVRGRKRLLQEGGLLGP